MDRLRYRLAAAVESGLTSWRNQAALILRMEITIVSAICTDDERASEPDCFKAGGALASITQQIDRIDIPETRGRAVLSLKVLHKITRLDHDSALGIGEEPRRR